nr:MAG TPA: hypothetical protein [Caudoviricetes sp.]
MEKCCGSKKNKSPCNFRSQLPLRAINDRCRGFLHLTGHSILNFRQFLPSVSAR